MLFISTYILKIECFTLLLSGSPFPNLWHYKLKTGENNNQDLRLYHFLRKICTKVVYCRRHLYTFSLFLKKPVGWQVSYQMCSMTLCYSMFVLTLTKLCYYNCLYVFLFCQPESSSSVWCHSSLLPLPKIVLGMQMFELKGN